MRKRIAILIVVLLVPALLPIQSHAGGDAQRGAKSYRACAACHSLEPGTHLTGPSLADVWGKSAASVSSFNRYSDALKSLDIVWNEITLNAWLADPEAMAPGNYMNFRGMEDEGSREDLIAFLMIALRQDGVNAAIESGLIPDNLAYGQVPESLAEVERARQITAMAHCRNSYFVTTADGNRRPYWETNVRLKIDASKRGPDSGPVLVSSGMMGDRVSVVFASVAAIGEFIKTECQ